MQFDESDLKQLIGTKSYRINAIEEALSEGRAAYGPVNIFVNLNTSMMEVRGPFFDTVIDLRELQQTKDGVSVAAVRKQIDDVICSQTEEHILETFW